MLIPPEMFPGRLQLVSSPLPSRGARDLVVWTVTGAPPSALTAGMFVVWTVGLAAPAAWAYRRDDGCRYR